jgi:hypothetical protein
MRLLLCGPTVALIAVLAIAADDPAQQRQGKLSTGRAYAVGPLEPKDFAGRPPEKTPVNLGIEMVANTECQVHYSYQSSLAQRGETWTARIVKFESEAVIVPEKCWITTPDSRRVLDHEQGHFDLAEIAARRAQKHFDGLIGDPTSTLSAGDKRAVQRALDSRIKKTMKEVYDSLETAQKTYDEETRHGTALVPQLRHRRWQRAELEKLGAVKSGPED